METFLRFFFFKTPLCKMRPAGRKTRVATQANDNHVSGGIIAKYFGSWFSDVNGIQTKGSERQMWRRLGNIHVLLHVVANGDCPVPLAMTHMRW